MNILIFNQDWFVRDFRAAGHNVLTCGNGSNMDLRLSVPLVHIDNIIKELPDNFKPDRILVLDNSAPFLVAGLEDCQIPSIFYSVDTHHHASLHKYFPFLFDQVLIAQRDYSHFFEALGRKPEWMPLWASRTVNGSSEKKHGAVFVGTLNPKLNPDRVDFFEKLQKAAQILCTSGDWEQIFPFSEVVINQTVKGDLNFRVFESMMCGAMLLTENSPNGLLDLFQDGKHLVTYEKGNVAQAAELIEKHLTDLSLTRTIAEAGRAEILAHHTESHRAQRMLTLLRSLELKHDPIRHYAAMTNYVAVARLFAGLENSTALRALSLALKNAEQGLRQNQPMSPELACYFIYACVRYDQLMKAEVGEALLFNMQEANQAVGVLGLACVRSHLNAGRRVQAEALAQSFAADSNTVFTQAEQVVHAILSS